MLSGSFLISALFDYQYPYGDYDLYFRKNADLKRALNKLDKSKAFSFYSKSRYASTYQNKKTKEKIQLIYKLRKDLKHLANSHDFHNCALAYCSAKKSLYISSKAYTCWTNGELDINVSPVFDPNYPDLKFFNQLALLLHRIQKYTDRYNVTISNQTRLKLKKLANNYNSRLSYYKYGLEYFNKPVLDYAGSRYVFVNVIKTAIKNGILAA